MDPDGGVASESAVTIGAGGINLDQDFGYRALVPNTIAGTLWEDLNADGTLDAGESNRFAGVSVLLYNTNGMLVASTMTDANGDYSFVGLPDGTYRVDVTDDSNLLNGYWHSDGTSDGADNNSQEDPYTVSVSGGQPNTTGDFGYYVWPAAVGNRVWEDMDGDGVQDAGEPGVSGVTVTLEIVYPNGTTVTVATVTSASGFYSFGNLLNDEDYNGDGIGPEPSYGLTATPPIGYVSTLADASGADDREDSDAAGVSAQPVQGVTDVDIEANPLTELAVASYDFGLFDVPTLALLSSFRAFARGGDVVVEWSTAEEYGTIGFFLEKQESDGASLADWSRSVFTPAHLQDEAISGDDADPDGDGLSNYEEYLAGTDPNSATSSLRLTGIEAASTGTVIQWMSEAGRSYLVEVADFPGATFTVVEGKLSAAPPQNVYEDTVVRPVTAVYRVRLELPAE